MKKKLLIALGIVVAVIVLFYFGLFLTAWSTDYCLQKFKACLRVTPDPNDPTQVVDKNAFKDSMKYDVVRDYKEKLEQEYLRAAKAQNKAEKESADAKDDPDKTQQLPRTKQNDELEL